MTFKQEIFIGSITFLSTTLTGDYIADLIIGVFTYTSARLFYHYFGEKIKKTIDKIKSWFKKRKKCKNI